MNQSKVKNIYFLNIFTFASSKESIPIKTKRCLTEDYLIQTRQD